MSSLDLLKSLHVLGIVLFVIMLILQTWMLFKNQEIDVNHLKYRRLFVIVQHSMFSVLMVTGLTLLYLKGFNVQHWFYAKVILFLVLMSAVIKAFKTRGQPILLVQRRGGVVLAWIALISILLLVWFKPVLFNG